MIKSDAIHTDAIVVEMNSQHVPGAMFWLHKFELQHSLVKMVLANPKFTEPLRHSWGGIHDLLVKSAIFEFPAKHDYAFYKSTFNTLGEDSYIIPL